MDVQLQAILEELNALSKSCCQLWCLPSSRDVIIIGVLYPVKSTKPSIHH